MPIKSLQIALLLLTCQVAIAQALLSLPDIAVEDLHSRKMVLLNKLPQNGKPQLLLITSQTDYEISLLAKLTDDFRKHANGSSLHIIFNDLPDNKTARWMKELNDSLQMSQQELSHNNIHVYKDAQNKILPYYLINHSPLWLFLDGKGNIVFSYEKSAIKPEEVIRIQKMVSSGALKANHTLFLDANGIAVRKEKAVYYREINPLGNRFLVRDYYSNGCLQMSGYYTSVFPAIRMGEFNYYSEKGMITLTRNYINNIPNGIFTIYDAEGNLFYKDYYVNGKIKGDRQVYYPGVAKCNSRLPNALYEQKEIVKL